MFNIITPIMTLGTKINLRVHKMMPSEYKRKKREANKKPKVHQNIANTFVENAIAKSNMAALKTIYYLSTILSKVDMENMKDEKIIGIRIDKREMLKYTEMSAPTVYQAVKNMQETSITFVDKKDGVIEGMALLPRYKFVPNKNTIELDLYVRIAKMIIDVKKNYTPMNTKEIMKLKKPHSIRMLALLNKIARYEDGDGNPLPKRKRMTLDELNEFFGVNYKSWNKIEEKIIQPIQEELNAHATKSFIYESNYENLGRGRPSFKDVNIDLVENAPRLF
jgi:plasmid replication initiation protein